MLDGGGLFGDRNVRTVVQEPVGVVGRDHPVELTRSRSFSTSSGPALATGNTVVLKPDPNTPWNATRLGRLIAEHTDIPPGVVNVVPTPANEVAGTARAPTRASTWCRSPGRPRSGKHADARRCRDDEAHLPRTGRQVGADRARRRQPVARSSPARSGSACTPDRPARSTTRLLMHRSLFDDVGRRRHRRRSSAVPVGDPALPSTFVRPGDQRRAEEAGARRLERARRDGAEIAHRRRIVSRTFPTHLAGGHFVAAHA